MMTWYEINKTYVAKVLCENKARPQLKCNGKCYLRKQLNKTENTQQDNKTKSSQIEWVDFIPVEKNIYTSVYSEQPEQYTDFYSATTGYLPITDIFHPPSLT